ncbi:MAG TPA: PA2779 family protein [Steroidobacteraceae bacterium]|nr:PA2779 family protein [Steroidobacteraceae bacterium]
MAVLGLSVALINMGTPAIGHAAIITTPTYVAAAQRDADLTNVTAALNRADVRDRMVALGVDPARVESRLSTMTDAELRELSTQFDQLPAGGDILALIGVVFIVLLILELVGVIDIFKKT